MGKKKRSHPLAGRELIGIQSWEHWLRLWNETNTAEGLSSLIRWARFVPDRDKNTVFCFLLEVADGHKYDLFDFDDDKDHSLTRSPAAVLVKDPSLTGGRPRGRDRLARTETLRHFVAREAWREICAHFAPDYHEDSDGWRSRERFPLHEVEDAVLIHKLLWFFDLERADNLPSRDVLDKDDLLRKGRYLVRQLVYTAWHKGYGYGHSKEVQAALYNGIPNLVRVLDELHFLEYLRSLPHQRAALPTLKELALNAREYTSANGPYETIEEAVRAGRSAAEVYLLLSTAMDYE